jgi:hypothetical protein
MIMVTTYTLTITVTGSGSEAKQEELTAALAAKIGDMRDSLGNLQADVTLEEQDGK